VSTGTQSPRSVLDNIWRRWHTPGRDHAWMRDAACRPDPTWTADHKPRPELLQALRDVCDHCPVIRQCAAHAITEKLGGGVYAGVWLPHRHYSAEWLRARAVLHHKTLPCIQPTKPPRKRHVTKGTK
jgi:Transcription factor WhiB